MASLECWRRLPDGRTEDFGFLEVDVAQDRFASIDWSVPHSNHVGPDPATRELAEGFYVMESRKRYSRLRPDGLGTLEVEIVRIVRKAFLFHVSHSRHFVDVPTDRADRLIRAVFEGGVDHAERILAGYGPNG